MGVYRGSDHLRKAFALVTSGLIRVKQTLKRKKIVAGREYSRLHCVKSRGIGFIRYLFYYNVCACNYF